MDIDVKLGVTYYYWLEAVAMDGGMQRFGPVSATFEPPTVVVLGTLDAASGFNLSVTLLVAAGAVGAVTVLRQRRYPW